MKSKIFYSFLIGMFFTIALPQSSAAQTTTDQPVAASQTQKTQTVKIKVSGITCSGDCKDIQKVVSKVNGVTSCKMIGKPSANSVFEVSFDPAVVSEKEIRKAVEGTPGCDNPNDRPYKVKQG